MNRPRRRPIGPLFKYAVSIAALGVIVWYLDGLGEVGALLARIDPLYALLVVAVATLDRFLMTYKWIRFLGIQGARLPLFAAMKIYCASMVWGMFLVATMGADLIRAYCTSRAGVDTKQALASIVIERMVGFISALVLGLGAFGLLAAFTELDERLRAVWWVGALVLAGAAAALAASFSERTFRLLYGRMLGRLRASRLVARLRDFHETYRGYRHDKRELAVFFALTFAEQLFPILMLWLIARGLGVEVALVYVAGALPLALLVSRLPVSVDGLGVFEGIFIVLMAPFGVTAAEAVSIGLAGRLLQVAAWLPWWFAYVVGRGSVRAPAPAGKES